MKLELDDLQDRLTRNQVGKTGPTVIGIAGGSASGKTTIAQELAFRLSGHGSVLFSQDLFQLGSDFVARKTSVYKWDDPQNFDLPAGVQALDGIRRSEAVTVPNFDVLANARQGVLVIRPADYIVWEGVYAFLTPELRQRVDLAIYVDVPYALRLVRRISRFLARDHIDDISVPARHMLSFVLHADQDFVASQKQSADIIMRPEQTESELQAEANLLVHRAAVHAADMVDVSAAGVLARADCGGLQLVLYQGFFALLGSDDQVIYATALDDAIIDTAAHRWQYITDAIDL